MTQSGSLQSSCFAPGSVVVTVLVLVQFALILSLEWSFRPLFFVCVNRQFVFYAQVRTCLFCWTIGNFHCKFVLCSIELVIDVLMFTKSNMVSFFGKKMLDVLTI
jgi:hypothetical protein